MTTVNQVDIGIVPNDAGGDPLRVAFQKINDNFNYLSSLAPVGPEGAIQYISDGLSGGDANLVYNQQTGVLDININTIPLRDDAIDLGSNNQRFSHLYLANSGVSIGTVTIQQSDVNTLSFPAIGGLEPENASINVKNVNADGNVNVAGSLVVNGSSSGTRTVTTHTNSTNQVVFELPVSDFDNGTFQITSRSLVGNNSQKVTLEVLKATSNIGVKFSAFGTLFSGDPITRYNADVGYGNVRVMVNPMFNQDIEHSVKFTINT
jgi:hypothetical protein